MATYDIKWLKDRLGTKFFPVTHTTAVRDNDGANLETLLSQKQTTLVSGNNIKTINNQSLLGSGDLTIKSAPAEIQMQAVRNQESLENFSFINAGTAYDILVENEGNVIITVDVKEENEGELTSTGQVLYMRITDVTSEGFICSVYNIDEKYTLLIEVDSQNEELTVTNVYFDLGGLQESDGEVISAALNDLDQRILNLNSQTQEIGQKGDELYNGIIENEKVVASALNDLNNRVDEVYEISSTALQPGDISIDISNKAEKIKIENHSNSETTFELTPNVYHIWPSAMSQLTLTLATPTDSSIVNEYMFEFRSGITASGIQTSLTLPANIKWESSKGDLIIQYDHIYQVSIINNVALWASVAYN